MCRALAPGEAVEVLGQGGPNFHERRLSTILFMVLPKQLTREMGLYFLGSLGLGMGTMSALFQVAGSLPRFQLVLMSRRKTRSPAIPMWDIMEWVIRSWPGVVSDDVLYAARSSSTVKSTSASSGVVVAISTSRCREGRR